jgi:hypothetical protein
MLLWCEATTNAQLAVKLDRGLDGMAIANSAFCMPRLVFTSGFRVKEQLK